MRTIIRFGLLATLVILISASRLTAQENPEEITAEFFSLYEKSGSDQAVDYVFSTNKWLNNEQTTIDGIKAQLKKGISIIGQYYGYELIDKKILGESYVMLSYMLRYDRQPIKFMFILYKPNQKWQIQNLKFDDRLDDDIEKF